MNIASQQERWVAAGSPTAPSLDADGVQHAVSHPLHAARLLGIEVDSLHDPNWLAADLLSVLDAWLACVEATQWSLLLEPTESRGRTPRELVVNVFKFAALLPGAWKTGEWRGALEGGMETWLAEERCVEATLTDRARVIAYMLDIRDSLGKFFRTITDELDLAGVVVVQTAGGELSYMDVLDGQRVHAGQHLRQVTTFLKSVGTVPAAVLEPLRDIPLPTRIY